MAILSRYPIIESQYKKLSRDLRDTQDEHQRVCLASVIGTPVGNITVLTTHLSLSGYFFFLLVSKLYLDKSRMRNVQEIWDFAQTLPQPQFLCGDLNTIPSGEAIQFLTGRVGGMSGLTPSAL